VAATIDANGLVTTIAGASGEETITARKFGFESESKLEVQAIYTPRFEMVTIPAGSFQMGSDNGQNSERPQHEVFLDAYEIGKFEITNAQYAEYLNEAMSRGDLIAEFEFIVAQRGPFRFLHYTDLNGELDLDGAFFIRHVTLGGDNSFEVTSGYEEHPVIRMSWYGAAAFCEFYGYRLPTEAEWEKAARGGQQLEYGTVDGTISHDLANYAGVDGNDSYEIFAPVGSFPANPFGIHDMSGNAKEFVFDIYDASYYSQGVNQNPLGPEPHIRIGALLQIPVVLRGGSWNDDAERLRSYARAFHMDTPRTPSFNPEAGFRVARTIQ